MVFLEIIGSILILLCVLTARVRHLSTWTLGIVGSIIFGIIFYESKLYADSALQLVYIGMGIMGLINWYQNKLEEGEVIIKSVGIMVFVRDVTITFCFYLILSYCLNRYTDAANPLIDSGITSLSLLANYYLVKQYIQTWFLWIIVDLGMIILMYISGLTISMVLYVALLSICVLSYYEWNKELKTTLSYVK